MILFDLPAWVMLPWLFVLGAVIGSFLNVCIYRIPHHETLWDQLRGLNSPPSRCPKCLKGILLRDNVPILGWLRLRGRCRNCGLRISPRYPLIELFNGLLFVFVYWYEIPFPYGSSLADSPLATDFGLTTSSILRQPAIAHWRYFYHMVLLEALLVASFIDFDTMTIPDAATVPAMVLAIVVGTAVPQVHLAPVWFSYPSLVQSYGILLPESWRGLLVGTVGVADSGIVIPAWIAQHPHWHGLAVSLAGLVVGGGIVWGVRLIGGWILRREAMGFGDVILMAMIGSFLGWQATLAVFFLAPAFAILSAVFAWLTKRSREIPYGPYLSLGALAMIVGWPQLWPSVSRLCQLGPLVPVFGVVMTALFIACLVALQLTKRALGIPLYDDEPGGEWTSADTLTYQMGENVERFQGRWKRDDWPGISAGRGTVHQDRWRNGH